jgi:uncharacterized spore protein YtfJ
MSAQLKETLSSIIGELKAIASTKTVIGEPLTLGDKMVVPVSRIMVGFGVGGGEGEEVKKRGGFAGGGAGGARIEPIGFILIDEDKISFLPTKPGRFEGLIDSIPGIVERLKKSNSAKRKGSENTEDEIS